MICNCHFSYGNTRRNGENADKTENRKRRKDENRENVMSVNTRDKHSAIADIIFGINYTPYAIPATLRGAGGDGDGDGGVLAGFVFSFLRDTAINNKEYQKM